MRFLLDTDTISFWLRGEGRVGEQLRALRPSQVCTSAIVVSELELGARRRGSRKLRRALDMFYSELTIAPYDRDAARRYGEVAAVLLEDGTPIGVEDTMVAAHTLALGLTLETHNVRHFERVPKLHIDDWY
jgi:tRNA(fMet)-specific endonuclease VapC